MADREVLGFVLLGFVLLGFVLLGFVLLGFVLLGFVLLGFVLLGFVLLGFEVSSARLPTVVNAARDGLELAADARIFLGEGAFCGFTDVTGFLALDVNGFDFLLVTDVGFAPLTTLCVFWMFALALLGELRRVSLAALAVDVLGFPEVAWSLDAARPLPAAEARFFSALASRAARASRARSARASALRANA